MPRKLVSDPYRGWYAWESHFNAAMRMSSRSLWALKMKNEKEDLSCKRHLDKITFDQRIETSEHSKTVKTLKREYNRLIAFKKVSDMYNFQQHEKLKENKPVSGPMKESNNVSACKPSRENKWKKILQPHLDRAKQDTNADETKKDGSRYSYDLFPSITLYKAKARCYPGHLPQTGTNFRRLLSKENGLVVPEKLRSETADQNWSQTLASVKGIVRWKTLMQRSKEESVQEDVPVGPNVKTRLIKRSVLPGDCKNIYALKKLMKKELKEAVDYENRKRILFPSVSRKAPFKANCCSKFGDVTTMKGFPMM